MASPQLKPGELAPHQKDMEKLKKNLEEANQIADTLEQDKGLLYHLALENIRDKNGKINYKLLDADKYGDQYHHKLADTYIKGLRGLLKRDFGVKDTLSEMESKRMIEGMYGETKQALLDNLAQHGSKYTLRQHKGQIEKYTEDVRKRLMYSASDHLKADDFASILKEMKAHNLLNIKDIKDINKPIFRHDIASLVHQFYDNGGSLTHQDVKGTQLLSNYLGKSPEVKLNPPVPK